MAINRINERMLDSDLKSKIQGASIPLSQKFISTNGQTVFNLVNSYETGKNLVSVEIDGVPQNLGEGFIESSSTSITLTETIPTGSNVKVTVYGTYGAVDSRLTDLTSQLADIATNVKSFGAKGDGVTDDTVAIQNAVNFVTTNKGILFFPPGIYRTTGTINVKSSIYIYGGFEKGDVGTGASSSRGAMIRYEGTGTVMQVKTDDGSYTHGFKIKGLRFSCTGSASKGLALINASEADVTEIHFNGGFGSALYLDSVTITNIETCDFSGNGIGLFVDFSTNLVKNTAINVTGCNFWQNSIAHIKAHQLTSVNIHDNWLEYSPVALWLDNNSNGGYGSFTNVKFFDNEVSVGDTVTYPNSRSIKVTASNVTKDMIVKNLFVERCLLYNPTADCNIEFTMTGATGNSYVYSKIANNLLWGGQTSAIKSDSGLVSLELNNNDCLNGYYGASVAETTGSGRFVGIDKKFDYLQIKGGFRLGQTVATTQAVGDLYWSTSSGTVKAYDGTANRILAFCDSGVTASRPTTNLYAGRLYFDTTLGKPVFYKGSSVWVDSAGTTV